MEIKKILVVGIIFLFIGVAVAPSINFNIVKASNDNDLVEVTTQACGIEGIRNHTVKMTQQQYQNFQQSLVKFKERLYRTTSREEVKEVYNEFIVELNEYGLLGRLSVKQARYLTTGFSCKFSERLLNKIKGLSSASSNSQYLIQGEAQQNTYFLGPIAILPSKIINLLSVGLGLISIFCILLGMLVISPSLHFATYINQKQILSNIFYGVSVYNWFDPEGHGQLYPASGSIWVSGPDGNTSWNGTFVGTISPIIYTYLEVGIGTTYHYYLGVIGFTGVRIFSNSTNVYFGSARKVGISSDY